MSVLLVDDAPRTIGGMAPVYGVDFGEMTGLCFVFFMFVVVVFLFFLILLL
jgi:hypothetical protein